jgi:hypothetical protein
MMGRNPLRAAFAAFATVAAGAAIVAPPAHAGILTKTATDCDDPATTHAFARYLDPMNYELVPGGTFEDGGAGWTLAGGAKVVTGNEPADVANVGGTRSLSLPAGSSAETPPICVGLSEPTLRFFAKKNSGLLSTMLVSVEFQLATGTWLTIPNGVDLGGGWHPSLPLPVIANLLPLLPPDRTAIKFRFTPILGGDWQLDDVYVDPFRHS